MKFFKKSEGAPQPDAIDELRRKISLAGMPADIEKVAFQELENLSVISDGTAEYTIGVTYIEYLTGMPWNRRTEDNLDLDHAGRVLDEDHYGLEAVKERIMEHLAVRVLIRNEKSRVLVVDDEEIARKNLVHILEKEDLDVVTAPDGQRAMALLDSSTFDIVITDLRMPGLDGMALLEGTKARHPDTGVIVVTGFATVPSVVDAMKKGACSYITKPYKLDDVRGAVKQALEMKSRTHGVKGSVLCFTGAPGTGKTSMGMSIARALGRKFIRLALGGIRDEAEIRGHRRTYAGAKPGRIIEAIRRVESSNPVIMLDELDKIGHDFKGDPASALLEVLDPEQNNSFVDHYLDVPFDLSNVLFIPTANVIEHVEGPLRDRMEIIEFSGYTEEEKVHIASRYLIPKQIREKGLGRISPSFTGESIRKIIQNYTREAGIRNLERTIATVCRKIAHALVRKDGPTDAVTVTPEIVERSLGRRKYRFEVVEEKDRVGVTTGLVLTQTGGDIIFVESAKMPGKKELTLTGSLGEVMRESAQAALSYIRSNAARLGLAEDFFEHHDIHIHVPLGSMQKDGPSAGIAMAMSLVSLLKNVPAKRDVAMTGEMTLTGRILPVSGIREKILAAKRAGVKAVVVPAKNSAEVDELPDDVRQDMELHLVDSVDEVVSLVLRQA